jgi:hypothetical protein
MTLGHQAQKGHRSSVIDPSAFTPPEALDLPALACDLGAFDAAERERHTASVERLRQAVEAVEELPDGYALRLPASDDAIQLSADFIAYERRCCPFFNFNLEVAPDGGPIRLRITGRPGVKAFLDGAFVPEASHVQPDN